MTWRRFVTWAATVHWFAVVAVLVAVIGVVVALTGQSTQVVIAVGVTALTLAVLALREE